MANFTSLVFEVESLKAAVALQQEQINAVQVTSDNVWILGRAFTVLTMVSSAVADFAVSAAARVSQNLFVCSKLGASQLTLRCLEQLNFRFKPMHVTQITFSVLLQICNA
jgi:hypothetical protein